MLILASGWASVATATAAIAFLVLVFSLYLAAGGMVELSFFSLMRLDARVEAAAGFSLDRGGMLGGECCQY